MRTCAYQGVKSVHFSENLTCFVSLKHPTFALLIGKCEQLNNTQHFCCTDILFHAAKTFYNLLSAISSNTLPLWFNISFPYITVRVDSRRGHDIIDWGKGTFPNIISSTQVLIFSKNWNLHLIVREGCPLQLSMGELVFSSLKEVIL